MIKKYFEAAFLKHERVHLIKRGKFKYIRDKYGQSNGGDHTLLTENGFPPEGKGYRDNDKAGSNCCESFGTRALNAEISKNGGLAKKTFSGFGDQYFRINNRRKSHGHEWLDLDDDDLTTKEFFMKKGRTRTAEETKHRYKRLKGKPLYKELVDKQGKHVKLRLVKGKTENWQLQDDDDMDTDNFQKKYHRRRTISEKVSRTNRLREIPRYYDLVDAEGNASRYRVQPGQSVNGDSESDNSSSKRTAKKHKKLINKRNQAPNSTLSINVFDDESYYGDDTLNNDEFYLKNGRNRAPGEEKSRRMYMEKQFTKREKQANKKHRFAKAHSAVSMSTSARDSDFEINTGKSTHRKVKKAFSDTLERDFSTSTRPQSRSKKTMKNQETQKDNNSRVRTSKESNREYKPQKVVVANFEAKLDQTKQTKASIYRPELLKSNNNRQKIKSIAKYGARPNSITTGTQVRSGAREKASSNAGTQVRSVVRESTTINAGTQVRSHTVKESSVANSGVQTRNNGGRESSVNTTGTQVRNNGAVRNSMGGQNRSKSTQVADSFPRLSKTDSVSKGANNVNFSTTTEARMSLKLPAVNGKKKTIVRTSGTFTEEEMSLPPLDLSATKVSKLKR